MGFGFIDGLRRWVADLRKRGLGWVQTRMGFETPLLPAYCIGYYTPVL